MTAPAFQQSGRRYVGLLAADTARRLQRLVRPFGCTIEACPTDTLLEALNGPAHVCAIVDPARLQPGELDTAITRLRQRPRAAVVYAQRSPESVSKAISITRETGAVVMFQSHDEDTSLLVHTIVSVGPAADAAMLLERIQPALEQLPDQLRAAITGMFAGDALPESPKSLAYRAGVSRRSLDRWLERVGISSARLLVTAPLMLRAFRLLQETELSLRIITSAAEMRTTARLRDGAVDLVGLSPRRIRVEKPSMTSLIDAAAARLYPDGAGRTSST